MRNFKLDNTWDLHLDPTTSNLAMVEGDDYTAQKIRQRLDTFNAEWFADRLRGLPWYDMLLGQVRPDLAAARAYIASEIQATPGVSSVDSLTIDAPPGASTATITFTATLSNGSQTTQEITL